MIFSTSFTVADGATVFEASTKSLKFNCESFKFSGGISVPEQAVNEPEPVADVVQVTRKRGRPRKSHNVEESSTTVRRSARSKK